ncbi:lysine-specific demethylase 2A-like [Oppia nitens]|uniref:lysine-specific demethylase 2A-like n=1 Tax=Oppia nitens TaxID=1686743 RepID=UPI0023DCA3BF|nr:lysine-specific demethylase 2A-like [Oppia nitens]
MSDDRPKSVSGPRLRRKQRQSYTETNGDDEDVVDFDGYAFDVDEKLVSAKFDCLDTDIVREMSGDELNVSFIQRNGFEKPIVVKHMKGLGMKMPTDTFNVNDVKQCVGSRRMLDVMDVQTQQDETMTMKEWCEYFSAPKRDRLLNVISLEFSHTKLETHVDSPAIVKQVDWVDLVWPKHLKQSQTEGTNIIDEMKYPKVQKYCLMSVKGCYTDFHIDFGGTSVWYHILKGRKVFWLIPPTERNIQLFEQWVLSGKQSDVFFGDLVEQCVRVHLESGYTFFIPTGWIHAVFTPEDSLVFGGNFLHSFSIEKQLRVAQVEDLTKVPTKFRYPFYTEVLWYVLARYVSCLMKKNHLKCDEEGVTIVVKDENNVNKPPQQQPTQSLQTLPSTQSKHIHLTPYELSGMKAIIMWLQKLPTHKRSVPDLIISSDALLSDAQILIDEHNADKHDLAVSGEPVLTWTKKLTKSQLLTSQLRSIKPPSYVLKQMRMKETPPLPAPPRAESPPTRPISSNQYATNTATTLNQDMIPSSFAGLIAQTGVNHYHHMYNPPTNSPLLSHSGTPITVQPMVSYMSPTYSSPLISTAATPPINPINSMVSSYQMANTMRQNESNYIPLPKEFSDHLNTNSNNNNNINLNNNNKLLNPTINGQPINHNLQQFSLSTSSQTSQNFNNVYINSKLSSPTMMTAPVDTQTLIQNQTIPPTTTTATPRPFPSAVPPSGFHSAATTPSESFMANKMVNTSTQLSSLPINSSNNNNNNTNQKMFASTATGTNTKSSSNDSSRRRRTRCKKCDSCLRADCGECHFCKDMKKFGGPGRMKQSCIARQCLAPVLPHTACCMICGRDGWEKLENPSINDETASSLMECSQCWEIVHPFCLNEKFPQLLASDANINEDLPNSWECPRCVKSGSKNQTKYQKSKSTTSSSSTVSAAKREENGSDCPPEKKIRLLAEESPPGSDDDEEDSKPKQIFNKNNNNNEVTDDTDNSNNSSHLGNQSKGSTTAGSSHVRSCARFPLLSQGLQQQMVSPSSTNNNNNNNNSVVVGKHNNSMANKPEVKGLAALANCAKKKNVTSRDRLFKSLKGLKKSSEQSRISNNSLGHQKKANNKSSSSTNSSSTNSQSMFTQCSSSSSNSSYSVSSPSYASMSPSGPPSLSSMGTQSSFSAIGVKQQQQHDINDESTDEEVDEPIITTTTTSVQQMNGNKQPLDNSLNSLMATLPKREIVKPKYVVRPAPLGCDVSESEESAESSDSDDESNDSNNNVKKERNKAKQKFFRKFLAKRADNLALERDVMVPVMRFLPKNDLLKCMTVCKQWNGFSIDPKLWPKLDLSHKKITKIVLIGIVLRQPRRLNLSWTNINNKQLYWLICRLPHLQALSLSGCPSYTVSALITCNCPLMASLDISHSQGVDDDFIKRLLSAPDDTRPGLMESKTRLRFIQEINLSGLNISDKSLRLITQNLTFVTRIDISSCRQITDFGIAGLATTKAKHLTELNLSGCRKISDMSLQSLRCCPSIIHLDVRECPQVNRSACHQFISQYPPQTKLICN